MSEEQTKKSEIFTDDSLMEAFSPLVKTPDRNLDGLLMSDLTLWERYEIAQAFWKLEEMGIAEVRKSDRLGRHTEELDRIVEAIDQYFTLTNHGGRLSSTMELVQYLMKFRSDTAEEKIQDTWVKAST